MIAVATDYAFYSRLSKIECPRFILVLYSTCQHLQKIHPISRFCHPGILTGELLCRFFLAVPD